MLLRDIEWYSCHRSIMPWLPCPLPLAWFLFLCSQRLMTWGISLQTGPNKYLVFRSSSRLKMSAQSMSPARNMCESRPARLLHASESSSTRAACTASAAAARKAAVTPAVPSWDARPATRVAATAANCAVALGPLAAACSSSKLPQNTCRQA